MDTSCFHTFCVGDFAFDLCSDDENFGVTRSHDTDLMW